MPTTSRSRRRRGPCIKPACLRRVPPRDEYWIESTGVFNTAELLINQLGLNPNNPRDANSQRLQLLPNHYVESVERGAGGRYQLDVNELVADRSREFTADIVVLAAGSIESPKSIRRSPVFNHLPDASKRLVGKGLTHH